MGTEELGEPATSAQALGLVPRKPPPGGEEGWTEGLLPP